MRPSRERGHSEQYGTPGTSPRGSSVDTKPEPLASRLRRTLRIGYRSDFVPVSVRITTWQRFAKTRSSERPISSDSAADLEPSPFLDERKVPTLPDSPAARRASAEARGQSLAPMTLPLLKHAGPGLAKCKALLGPLVGFIGIPLLIVAVRGLPGHTSPSAESDTRASATHNAASSMAESISVSDATPAESDAETALSEVEEPSSDETVPSGPSLPSSKPAASRESPASSEAKKSDAQSPSRAPRDGTQSRIHDALKEVPILE